MLWLYGQDVKCARAPMALDPEEIVAILMIAAIVIVWNWRLSH